ncbi:hypothetical protein ACPEEZ_06555 [Frigoribacterium sp. 2-23]|uniref:hypothetical protein n=1 Tax=Frigoribacterium sp. 2-23 TaxID=3415006 RepID=UPI003C6F4C53
MNDTDTAAAADTAADLADLLPVLPYDPTDEDLCRFVSDSFVEPADGEALCWLFVDDEGRLCPPLLRFDDLPAEPDRADVDELGRQISLVADAVGASRVVLVWQQDERTPEVVQRTRRWTSLMAERLPRYPALLAQVARTPDYLQVIVRPLSPAWAPAAFRRRPGGHV